MNVEKVLDVVVDRLIVWYRGVRRIFFLIPFVILWLNL